MYCRENQNISEKPKEDKTIQHKQARLWYALCMDLHQKHKRIEKITPKPLKTLFSKTKNYINTKFIHINYEFKRNNDK
jgi:hypothetical protein